MENDCKASWDYLRLISKHDGPTNMKLKYVFKVRSTLRWDTNSSFNCKFVVCFFRMSEFLADCAERIIVLGIVHRRVINRFVFPMTFYLKLRCQIFRIRLFFKCYLRFHKFLLWLGVSAHQVTTTKPQLLFKIISEFALEYRTTRERVIQQMQKKANHRERNKTRGKMITEVGWRIWGIILPV